MLIQSINHILKWVQITVGGKSYTCPMKEINGELFFNFKKQDHRVAEYISKLTQIVK